MRTVPRTMVPLANMYGAGLVGPVTDYRSVTHERRRRSVRFRLPINLHART